MENDYVALRQSSRVAGMILTSYKGMLTQNLILLIRSATAFRYLSCSTKGPYAGVVGSRTTEVKMTNTSTANTSEKWDPCQRLQVGHWKLLLQHQ